ncbi:MAG: uridine kinase [Gemmatimonadetes bacterium]|nr:uridine kinase [Gemmatimonadota bacterium]
MSVPVRPVVLGVAGGSGSGKSTVVKEVRRILGNDLASVLHHDAYYRDLAHLPFEARVQVNFDHPDALETELMAEHLRDLLRGEAAEVPTYDFSTHTRTRRTERVRPTPVVVVDGILVLADARLRDVMDLKVFVDTEADIRLLRRIRRDVVKRGRTADSVIAQYETTVRPMHLEFVEPSKRFADLVVPEGGYNRVAVDLVVARLRALMAERSAPAPA